MGDCLFSRRNTQPAGTAHGSVKSWSGRPLMGRVSRSNFACWRYSRSPPPSIRMQERIVELYFSMLYKVAIFHYIIQSGFPAPSSAAVSTKSCRSVIISERRLYRRCVATSSIAMYNIHSEWNSSTVRMLHTQRPFAQFKRKYRIYTRPTNIRFNL
jgi:hypothetical protein